VTVVSTPPRRFRAGHIRSWLWTIPASFALTALCVMNAVACMLVVRKPGHQQKLRSHWGRAVLRLVGGRMRRVSGAVHVRPGSNYVVAANHASLMDIPALFGYLPLEIKFLAKIELLKVPFIGWYLRRDHHLTVDRHNLRSSIQSTNACARRIQAEYLNVLIFPEGSRSLDGRLQRFRDGAAFLALQSGVPVLPVAVVGTHRLLPARSSCFTPSELELRIGPPIATAHRPAGQRGALTAEIEAAVQRLLEA
jgi:1-acyl-sn-glycerol-3-phosphate acyltransferase